MLSEILRKAAELEVEDIFLGREASNHLKAQVAAALVEFYEGGSRQAYGNSTWSHGDYLEKRVKESDTASLSDYCGIAEDYINFS